MSLIPVKQLKGSYTEFNTALTTYDFVFRLPPNTRANIISQTPPAGTRGFATDDKKDWMYNGTTWQVTGETIELTNKAGATLNVGDLVQISTGTNLAVQYPTISGDSDTIGVVAIGGIDGNQVTVAIRGIWDVSVLLACTRENFLTNSVTTLYYGTDNGSAGTSGNVAYILESNATTTVKLVKCLIGFTGETF